jgi:hypothetical protein
MSDKFGRSYRVVIDPLDGGDNIVVTMPLTINFDVRRSILDSFNTLDIDIYNLGKSARDRIFQDRFNISGRKIRIEGGYDTLSVMFDGTISEASSARDGTNIITRISAFSGKFDVTETQTFTTIEAGATVSDVLKFLIGQFPTLEMGAVGDFSEVIQRPTVLNGNTYDLIRKYSDNQVFIDNNRVYVLKRYETNNEDVFLINSQTGLLETPRRDDAYLTTTTLFEPRINIGQRVELNSEILPVYNGQYKIVGIHHQGMISEAVGGNCRTVLQLFVGNNRFEVVN